MFKHNAQNRRGFFKSLVKEAVSAFENNMSRSPIGNAVKRAGQPESGGSFCLSNLWLLPDERIGLIKPVNLSHIETIIENGNIYARLNSSDQKILLFTQKPENMFVFERFKSRLSIEEISNELSREMNWEPAQAFQFVKNMFLSLVDKRICLPANPIG
jgi:hypothetical protein